MLYKEFEERLDGLGLFVEHDYGELYIKTQSLPNVPVARLIERKQYDLYILNECMVLSPMVREKLFNLLMEYIHTPIEERVEEKKYNVVAYREKGGYPDDIVENTIFYYRGQYGELLVANDGTNGDEDQQWTMKQIEQYSLEDCERIEVAGED